MPQLDPSSFISQLFWLALTFGALYLLMARVALPRVSDLREQRADRIEGDLASAQSMKDEADAARESYEKALAEARAKAQETSLKTRDEIRTKSEARQTALADEIAEKTKSAEAEIAKAKGEALSSIRDVSVEACKEILLKVSNLELDDATIAAAVDAELKSAGRSATQGAAG
jgi:F-type H+-transporting ATPase subunit b